MFPLRPPFMNFPFNNFYNYRKPTYLQNNMYGHIPYSKNSNLQNQIINSKGISQNDSIPSSQQNKGTSDFSETNFSNFNQSQEKNAQENTSENYFFEVFGLKLFFDDVLLICLLFFLYEEGVKDQELFISLILLLLS